MVILKRSSLIAVLLMTFLLSACMNERLTGTSYTRTEARAAQTIKKGVVIDIQQVNIESNQTGVGAAAGTIIGALSADGKNGKVERQILQVLTGILGGVAGEYIERKVTTRSGYELVVDLDDGSSLSIVQEEDINMPFQVGDVVRIVERGSTVRVVRTQS